MNVAFIKDCQKSFYANGSIIRGIIMYLWVNILRCDVPLEKLKNSNCMKNKYSFVLFKIKFNLGS